jgi:multidrug efflux pump subunit AcrA (membrane-fusion protein)
MRERLLRMVLVAAAVGPGSCGSSHADQERAQSVPTTRTSPPEVHSHDRERHPGVALSARHFELRAPMSSRIAGIPVEHGDLVGEGDVLAILDSEDGRAELEVVQAELRAQQRAGASARAAWRVARRRQATLERLRGDGYAPAETVESAELAVEHAAAEVDGLEAGIQGLRARVARLRAVVDEHQLRSPMAGVVAERLVDVGAFVAPATTILRVVSEHADLVRFAVDPEDRGAWTRGRRVDVWSTASARLTGAVVQSIASEVDPATNLLFVDATVEDTNTLPVGLAVWVIPAGVDP